MSEQPTQTTTEQTELSAVEQLVQLKKNEDFRNLETVAKSTLAANEHIGNLERQLAELREELNNRMSSEEVLKAIEAKTEQFTQSKPTVPESTQGLDTDKVEELIKRNLAERTQQETIERNLSEINTFLESNFGNAAVEKVKERARDLGMSPEGLVEIGRSNPKAFAELVGAPKAPQSNSQVPNHVNTQTDQFSKTGDRDYSFYDKIRKENPKLYFSPKTQKQLQADAARLGDRFFAN